jgi:hypothetical protein
MTRAATPEETADHTRDLRKHDAPPKRMPADAVEVCTFATIRRLARRSEGARKRYGVRPITLAPLPASWDNKDRH